MRAIFQPAAIRALAAVPKKDRASLLRKLERFAADPFAPNKPLKGQPQAVRIRQGDWRANCRIDRANETVIIEAIRNRREIYQ